MPNHILEKLGRSSFQFSEMSFQVEKKFQPKNFLKTFKKLLKPGVEGYFIRSRIEFEFIYYFRV